MHMRSLRYEFMKDGVILFVLSPRIQDEWTRTIGFFYVHESRIGL